MRKQNKTYALNTKILLFTIIVMVYILKGWAYETNLKGCISTIYDFTGDDDLLFTFDSPLMLLLHR